MGKYFEIAIKFLAAGLTIGIWLHAFSQGTSLTTVAPSTKDFWVLWAYYSQPLYFWIPAVFEIAAVMVVASILTDKESREEVLTFLHKYVISSKVPQ